LRVRHGSILCEQSPRKLHQRMDTNETPEAQVPQIAQSARWPWSPERSAVLTEITPSGRIVTSNSAFISLTPMLKRCSHCKAQKSLTDFWKCISRKDGLQHRCKQCSAIFQRRWARSESGRRSKRKYKKTAKGRISERRYAAGEARRNARRRQWQKLLRERNPAYLARQAVGSRIQRD